jgi:hypothetical protein
MRIVSFLILLGSLFFLNQVQQSPHGQGFKVSCKTCHSSKGWELDKSVYSFDHNSTKMPLLGQHKTIDCRQCHVTLVFNEAKLNCSSCHNDIHQATTGSDCARCHSQVSWLVTNITDLHQVSRFPLLGAHRMADCSQCHISESLLRFDIPGVNCVDCHRANYMATTNPNHLKSGMSENCSLCHPVNSFQWAGAGFDHSIFPLVQGHSAIKCTDCHKTGGFTNVPSSCNSCHQQDFLATKNPDHSASHYSTNCQECHTLAPGWKPTTFNHTSFPLTQGHSTAACTDCHTGGNYASVSTDCYTCHKQDYLATTKPNHASSGIATTCKTCHTTTPGWKPTTFNHSVFPLTLGHAIPVCTDCHKNGNYTTTPKDCYGCHQQDYLSSTNPNHSASGLPTVCLTCHTTNPGWKPATYNHASFPLTLGHSTASCNDCHKGNYTTTSTDCYSCHQTDYNNSTNPNHKTLNFSTTCTQCHTTVPGWRPASYAQHDAQFFPIYSGKHRAQWNTCTECHTNVTNYTLFNCITCHSNVHSGKNYTNAQCYSCHPRGVAD